MGGWEGVWMDGWEGRWRTDEWNTFTLCIAQFSKVGDGFLHDLMDANCTPPGHLTNDLISKDLLRN